MLLLRVVRKYKELDSSCSDFLQFVFVVKPAEYGNCRHTMVIRNVMPFGLEWELGKLGLWNSRSQTRMRTASIEMGDARFENHSSVAFTHGNHEIQAFPSGAAHKTFTKGIRLRCSVGRMMNRR